MRALITGGGGQLASDLQELLGADARSYSHAELDIADSAALDRAFDEVRPDVVFNCAAFHNVDVCETEPDSAWAVNVRAVRDLAGRGAKLVHLSTNYVFDGRREEPYGEDDLPNPRSIYALTKYQQERACLIAGEAYGIPAVPLRFFNVYGPRQALSNPYTGVLAIFASRLLNDRPPRIFEDGLQRRDFVSVHDVARVFATALEHGGGDGLALSRAAAT